MQPKGVIKADLTREPVPDLTSGKQPNASPSCHPLGKRVLSSFIQKITYTVTPTRALKIPPYPALLVLALF